MLLKINPNYPQPRLITKVVEILKDGGIIVYPTDTTYGLGCNIFNKKAIEKIYLIKRMSKHKPLSFICSNFTEVSKFAKVSKKAYRIMRHLLPGPYTFILPATNEVPKLMLSRFKTVGIRIPDNKICLAIVKELQSPIVNTTVTMGDEVILYDPVEMQEKLGRLVDVIIDGGITVSDPSSVIDLTGESPTVLRKGKGDVSMFM